MKKIISLMLAIAMSLTLASCNTPGGNPSDSETVTVTDQAGDTVTVPKNAERIAVCGIFPLPSVLAVFFDSAEKIVGMPKESMTAAQNSLLGELYPEILNAATGYSSGSDVNAEELMALNPDVVFYSADDKKMGEQLKKSGFAAVGLSVNILDYNAITTLSSWIELLGQIFPENAKGKAVSEYSKKVSDNITERVSKLSDEEKAKVFFLFKYSDSSIVTSGDNFFGDWWADAVGAVNVAKELTGDNAQPVNFEQIYAWNPQKIFITNFNTAQPEDLYNNTVGTYDWSGIDAVKNHEVYKMPLGMYRSYTPGVDTPITLMWLAKSVYPNLFEDIDITKETKDYYKKIFDVELTDAQAERVFNPSSKAGSGM